MTSVALLVAAVLTAAAPAPQAEIRNVRIMSPKITVSRPKAGADVIVGGQIRVEMSLSQKTVKKPVVRLVCLCEKNGELSVQTVFLDRPRAYEGMSRSEIAAAFKRAGVEVPYKERDVWLSDPAKFTPYLSEVAREPNALAVYGGTSVNKGFFSLGRSDTMPKALLFRVEVWQNGVRTAAYESSRSGLGTLEIPEDWHLYKKYPQKFKYADIR